MKTIITFLIGIIFFWTILVKADTHTASNDGNWSVANTWDIGIIPASTDIVVIPLGITVHTNGNQTCNGIEINGVLDLSKNDVITINGNISGSGTMIAGSNNKTITLTGNWSFNGTSNIQNIFVTFNGTGDQTLSGVITSGIGTLTIDKQSGSITMNSDITITNITLTRGNIITGTKTLTLGNGISNLGTLSRTSGTIIGKFARWFSNSTTVSRLFPVGTSTYYRPVELSFTTAPTSGGTLTVEHIASDPGNNGTTTIDDGGYLLDTYSKTGYWKINAGNGLTGGIYSLNLTMGGIIGVVDVLTLRIIKRANSGALWSVNGNHVSGSGTNTNSTSSRSNMSGFSEFAIADNFLANPLDGALPVNLLSLNATSNGRNVCLNWTTNSEINNSGFNVERMNAGTKVWETLGFVKGKGTVNVQSNYFYEDKNLQAGRYQYRLKQVDINGNSEYFVLKGDVEVCIPKKFSMSQNYPNPFNPVTKIDFDIPYEANVKIVILDLTGREVMTILNEVRKAGYHSVYINASDLASSVYFYRIISDKYISSKKMILIK